MKSNLKLASRSDGWWITNWPEEGFEDCGPYDTKQLADEDRRGLTHTLEHWDDRAYWTVEKRRTGISPEATTV